MSSHTDRKPLSLTAMEERIPISWGLQPSGILHLCGLLFLDSWTPTALDTLTVCLKAYVSDVKHFHCCNGGMPSNLRVAKVWEALDPGSHVVETRAEVMAATQLPGCQSLSQSHSLTFLAMQGYLPGCLGWSTWHTDHGLCPQLWASLSHSLGPLTTVQAVLIPARAC